MWKESYRIGIEAIDSQHIELFKMVDLLLKSIESNADIEEFKKAVEFLKKYVVYHFKTEEEYQKSVNYVDFEQHKKLHVGFTNDVISFEKKLIESNYDIKIIKDLAGTLTAWLIYHVADADLKFAENKKLNSQVCQKTYLKSFTYSIIDVLNKMMKIDFSIIDNKEKLEMDCDLYIKIDIIGDLNGSFILGFPQKIAFELIKLMTFIEVSSIDEFVCSALSELTNIASGNATIELSENGVNCDIKIPLALFELDNNTSDFECSVIESSLGNIKVLLNVK